MKKRYYTVKHGTLRALQEFADKHNVEVRREGGSKALRMYRPDGKWRTVVDFKTNSVPQGVRDRAFEEWRTHCRLISQLHYILNYKVGVLQGA